MTKQVTIVVLCDVNPNMEIDEDLCSASFCYETNGPYKEKVETTLLDETNSFGFSAQFQYFKYDLTVSDKDAKRFLDQPDTIDEILSDWKGDD